MLLLWKNLVLFNKCYNSWATNGHDISTLCSFTDFFYVLCLFFLVTLLVNCLTVNYIVFSTSAFQIAGDLVELLMRLMIGV